LLGGGRWGQLRDELEQLAKNLGNFENIEFTGVLNLSEVITRINAARAQ
jgi:glycosyltransferase involved in cell wall biosynthesis